jgi:3-hydroxybutyryl-CoA dehydratase
MNLLSFDDIEIGQSAGIQRTIDAKDIEKFAELSGDNNPIHLDENFAKKTRFKGRIAHGMLTASFISTVLAKLLPGPGSVYLKQDLIFKKPVRIGDVLTIRVEVIGKDDEKERIILKTMCLNQNGEVVIDGTATTMLMKI